MPFLLSGGTAIDLCTCRLPGGDHHDMVLQLFHSVGNRYRQEGRTCEFVLDLFALDVPNLFAPSPLTKPDDCLEGAIGPIASQFKAQLRIYIEKNGLKKSLLVAMERLLVSQTHRLVYTCIESLGGEERGNRFIFYSVPV